MRPHPQPGTAKAVRPADSKWDPVAAWDIAVCIDPVELEAELLKKLIAAGFGVLSDPEFSRKSQFP